jgi:hypothetical protein
MAIKHIKKGNALPVISAANCLSIRFNELIVYFKDQQVSKFLSFTKILFPIIIGCA